MCKLVFIYLLICLTNLTTTNGMQLPPFIKKCKFNDKTLPKCVMDSVPIVMPHLKNGLKELKIPKLAPLHLKEVIIDATKDFQIKIEELDIFHLEKMEMKGMQLFPEKFHTIMTFFFDELELIGTYDVDGKILIIPIKGHGPLNLTIYNFLVNYEFSFPPYEKNGKQYVRMENPKFHFESGHLHLQMENLFGGDKDLGKQVISFLNDNWREVEDILRPAVSETVIALVTSIFNTIADSFSIDEIFDM